MNEQTSYPSDEVARHTAHELVREAPCGLLVVLHGNAIRIIRFGEPPEGFAGGTMESIGQAVEIVLDLEFDIGEEPA